MKKLLVTLFILIISFSVSAQTKRPVVKPTPKPTSTNAAPVTETEATTKDGKKIILKSDKTWDFAKENTAAKGESVVDQNVSRGYLQVPFDPNVSTLPKNFLGHDFYAIHAGVRGTRPFKSEFETTEVYSQKVANKQALDKSSCFAFFPSEPYLAYDLSYDADLQKFKVEIRFEDKELFEDETLFIHRPYEYIIDFHLTITSKYVAHYGILVTNGKKLSSPLLFEIQAERAKLIKDKGTLLVIFSLSSPYQEYSIGAVPRVLLIGNITGLWLVNKETGEIYQKLDLPK